MLSEMEGRPEFGVTSGQIGWGQRLWIVSVVAVVEPAALAARRTATRTRALAMAVSESLTELLARSS